MYFIDVMFPKLNDKTTNHLCEVGFDFCRCFLHPIFYESISDWHSALSGGGYDRAIQSTRTPKMLEFFPSVSWTWPQYGSGVNIDCNLLHRDNSLVAALHFCIVHNRTALEKVRYMVNLE